MISDDAHPCFRQNSARILSHSPESAELASCRVDELPGVVRGLGCIRGYPGVTLGGLRAISPLGCSLKQPLGQKPHIWPNSGQWRLHRTRIQGRLREPARQRGRNADETARINPKSWHLFKIDPKSDQFQRRIDPGGPPGVSPLCVCVRETGAGNGWGEILGGW